MAVLVFGGLVQDFITIHPDLFANQILPEHGKRISASFNADSLRRSWGGTGGNISYNLKLLGEEPVLVSALGRNGVEYLEHLQAVGISIDHIVYDPDSESPICFITTDMINNQINTYFAGPTDMASKINIKSIAKSMKDIRLAIISPSTKALMLEQIQECKSLKIETIFDPGQQIANFSCEELRLAIEAANFIFCNDSEIKLLEAHSGWSKEFILDMGKTIVTTYGGEGSSVENTSIGRIDVPACEGIIVEDPTGAGDAYRAGFILGHERDCGLDICAKLGSVAASIAVETFGTQNHCFDFDDFIIRYEANYEEFPMPLVAEWELVSCM